MFQLKVLRLIKSVWKRIRFTPYRIYKYGTAGLHIFDDRSLTEKLCDSIDGWIERMIKKYKHVAHTQQVWHSFFDPSTGTMITSMSDIRKIEREKGYTYMSWKDIEKEAKRNQEYNKKAQTRMCKKKIAKIVHDIKQGRSFIKETNERIRHGDYEIGKRQAMNG